MDSVAEMSHEEVLKVKLQRLRDEHRDLDEAIAALEERRTADQLALRRLKGRISAMLRVILRAYSFTREPPKIRCV